MLLDAADARAALLVRDGGNVHAADGDRALLRVIEPQQQTEDRALARACAADQRDLLALLNGKGQVSEHRALAVAERHVREDDVSARGGFFTRRGNVALQLGEERVDALDARHRGLDGLDLHAEAFDRREDTRNIVDDRDRRADGHAEQRQHARVSRSREQHHRADDGGAEHEYDGGVDRVVKVCALNGGVALADAAVVALRHVVFEAEGADGADIVQRLRHLTGDGGDGAAVVELRCEHALLHIAGEEREQRQHEQEKQCKSRIFECDDDENGKNAARIRRHRDDARGEQRLDRVDIAGKARGDLAGGLRRERRGGEPRQLGGELGAQRVRHLLPENFEQRLLRGGQHALERERAEVEQRRRKDERHAAGQRVDDLAEQQRRQERGEHRGRRAEQRPRAEKLVVARCVTDGGKHAGIFVTLHVRRLLSGFRRERGMPQSAQGVLHACRRWLCRPP